MELINVAVFLMRNRKLLELSLLNSARLKEKIEILF